MAGINVFEVYGKLGLDTGEYEKALGNSESKTSKFASTIGRGLKTAAKVGAASIAAVASGAGALATAFVEGASEVAQYGDNIDKMSQKMGLSAKAYQEWDFIMQHSGTSIESLQASMKTLANAVDSGNDAFKRLGISQSEIASMNQEELFARTIEELQKVEDTTERTYLAGQLLGRGATELGALLNTSAEETEAMRKQVHELGGVMSDETVKSAAAYQDSLQNMQTAFSGLKRGMLSEFLPSIVSVMDGLALIFSGNDSGIAKITSGIEEFVKNLSEKIPQILELGGSIIESLASAIIENLPTIVKSASFVILTLASGIVAELPEIIQLGFDLIISLAQGIAENLPELIPTIISVVLEIVNILTDPQNLSMLLEAALEIIIQLAYGLMDAIPQLVGAVVDIITSLVTFLLDPENITLILGAALEIILALGSGLISAIPELIRSVEALILKIVATFKDADWQAVGGNLVDGFKRGIQNAWGNLKKWFTNLFGDLTQIAKDILGIASPSKVFKSYGKFIDEGLALGISQNADVPNREIEKLASGITTQFDVGVASAPRSTYGTTSAQGTSRTDELLMELISLFVNGTAVTKVGNTREMRRIINA